MFPAAFGSVLGQQFIRLEWPRLATATGELCWGCLFGPSVPVPGVFVTSFLLLVTSATLVVTSALLVVTKFAIRI